MEIEEKDFSKDRIVELVTQFHSPELVKDKEAFADVQAHLTAFCKSDASWIVCQGILTTPYLSENVRLSASSLSLGLLFRLQHPEAQDELQLRPPAGARVERITVPEKRIFQ